MRDYAKVSPQFWHGKTGKELKAKGPEAVIVGLYLLTCQHANMIGLYYLSKTYIAVDTGLGLEGASKGLASACEALFCMYDEASEVVYVPEMAAYQVGNQLEAKDNRCKGIQREYDALPENPFLTTFYERYSAAFHMTSCRGKPKPLGRGSKAPPKPRTGTRAVTRTGEEDTAPEARELSMSDLLADGVERGNAEAWHKVRKAKRASPLTQLAWDAVKREAAKAGMTANEAVKKAAERNWIGFESGWLHQHSGGPVESEAARLKRERMAEAAGPFAAKPKPTFEVFDGNARIVG